MSYEVIRVLQIIVCILVGVIGIYIVFQCSTTAVRAITVGLTLLALIFSWDIGYFIYELLCVLLEGIFMACSYVFMIALACVFAVSPILIILKWLLGR